MNKKFNKNQLFVYRLRSNAQIKIKIKMLIFDILPGLLLTILILGFFWLIKIHNYWMEQGVRFIPSPLLLGNFWRQLFMIEQIKYTLTRMYHHPASQGNAFVGIHTFNKPAIFVLDIELVKRILVKDFNHFSDRHVGADPKMDPIGGNNLFQVKNPLWRKLRLKLTPVFTSGKMKQIFYLVDGIGATLHKQLTQMVNKNPIIEVRELASSFTVDTIALSAFATEAKCLEQDKMTEFKRIIFNCVTSSWFKRWSVVCTFLIPSLLKYIKITTFTKEFENFMRRLFKDVVTEREKSGTIRNDLVDALIAVKRAEQNDDEKSKYM